MRQEARGTLVQRLPRFPGQRRLALPSSTRLPSQSFETHSSSLARRHGTCMFGGRSGLRLANKYSAADVERERERERDAERENKNFQFADSEDSLPPATDARFRVDVDMHFG